MTDRYLTIGNNYPGTGAELRGCVNDALDVAALLKARGYQGETVLEATGAQMRAGIERILAMSRRGDTAVIHYSGHGTNIPDTGGDEADGRDEALVPVDFRTNGVLTDDELQRLYVNRRFGVRLIAVMDSCFSGTVTDSRRFVGLIPAGKAKMLPPELMPPVAQGGAQRRSVRAAVIPNAMLLAAALDSEYAYDGQESSGRPCGAFTLAVRDAFAALAAPTWAQVAAFAADRLPNVNYPQTPTLTATAWQRRWPVMR